MLIFLNRVYVQMTARTTIVKQYVEITLSVSLEDKTRKSVVKRISKWFAIAKLYLYWGK